MNDGKLAMEISLQGNDPGIAVLKVTGYLDFSGIAMLSKFFETMTVEDRKYVIIDLSEATAMCSAALGEFMGYRKRFVEKGGSLVFAGLTGDIRSKLTLMGANKIFPFFPDVRGAIDAYKWNYKKQSKSLSVTFPASLKLVPPARQLVSRLAKQKGYSTKDAFRIETIVDEVCNNAVEHGLANVDGAITMRVMLDKEKVDITVSNKSDPEKVKLLKELTKPATERGTHVGDDDKRGRGLALIRMLSNDMDVEITDCGTSVHVIKIREESK